MNIYALPLFAANIVIPIFITLAVVAGGFIIYLNRSRIKLHLRRILTREDYTYRNRAIDYADRIQNLFSLKEQGNELLNLVIKVVSCRSAGLLFPGVEGDFAVQQFAPSGNNSLADLVIEEPGPILQYLKQERKYLSRGNLQGLSDVSVIWETAPMRQTGVEVMFPLISRDKLIAVLALGKKQSGRYTAEDLDLIGELVNRVAVSMEKESLREQLHEHEREVTTINRAASMISSSLDVQSAFGSAITELSSLVEIDWAAITLIQDDNQHFMASWPESDPIWQPGERVPLTGMMTDIVLDNKEALYVPDICSDNRLTNFQRFTDRLSSVICLPLIVRGTVTGSLYVASRKTNVYKSKHVSLLEQLASQIAMPVGNAWLYMQTQEMARIDQLTGLLNRRSFDEMLSNEIRRCTRYGGIFSIIILDLDSLKAYNDTYGHLAGDKLINQIGVSIKSSIRVVDYAFRYGGDEFAILLPQTPSNAGVQVGERIRKKVLKLSNTQSEAEFEFDAVPVTASLGLAMWPSDGVSQNEIISAADEALYQAKRKGGNMVLMASGTLTHFRNVVAGLAGTKDEKALGTIYALWAKLDARAHNSHSEKVSEYASALGHALKLDQKDLLRLETCALLHDIGKIVISDEILNKRGELTAQEWELIKAHPQLGANIASLCQLDTCVAGIRHHHERYDGTGYPDGLKGEEIPLEARILAIADAFAAMTSERSYSNILSLEKALEEITNGSGKQFDPKLSGVFVLLFNKLESEDGVIRLLGVTKNA